MVLLIVLARTSTMVLLRATTIVFVLVGGTLAPAAARQGTPAAGDQACVAPRREIPAIAALLNPPPPATPRTAPGATPDPTDVHAEDHTHAPAGPAPVEPVGTPRLLRPDLPEGTPADPNVMAAVTETMRRYLACANAGDVIGLMSLVSDDFLRQTFGPGRLSEADLRAYAAAGRPLPPSDHRRLMAVREARVLDNGQVVALVDHAPAASRNPNAITTDLVTLTPSGSRYLIDRYLAGVTIWFGPNATPGP